MSTAFADRLAAERWRDLGHEARHLVLHARVRLQAEIEVEDHLVEAGALDLRLQVSAICADEPISTALSVKSSGFMV